MNVALLFVLATRGAAALAHQCTSLARFGDVLTWSMASAALSGIAVTGLSKMRHCPATKGRGKLAPSRQRSEIWQPIGSGGRLQSVLEIVIRLNPFDNCPPPGVRRQAPET